MKKNDKLKKELENLAGGLLGIHRSMSKINDILNEECDCTLEIISPENYAEFNGLLVEEVYEMINSNDLPSEEIESKIYVIVDSAFESKCLLEFISETNPKHKKWIN